MTALARYTLRAHAVAGLRPSYQLARLNDALLRQRAPGFVTVALARLELTADGARVEVATAGHPAPILARAGSATPLGEIGTPLGIIERPELPEVTADLGPGDLLAFYTDGVSDAAAPRRLLSEPELAALVAERAADGPTAVVQHLEATAVEIAAGTPRDDIACLALQVTPPRVVSERFPATTHAARDVAAALAPVSDELGPRTAQDLRLLATELVANAVRHTGVPKGSVEVQVRLEGDVIHLACSTTGRASSCRSGRSRRPTARVDGACTSSTNARGAGATNVEIATACGSNWTPVRMPPEIVAVTGEVTFSNVAELNRRLDAALTGDARDLVVDLSDVTFIDSSGLSALLTASAQARERGGEVALVLASAEPPSIFRFRGVDRLLALYPSREAALAGLA